VFDPRGDALLTLREGTGKAIFAINLLGGKHGKCALRGAAAFMVEPLESRRLLTSVVVNTTLDQSDPTGSSTVSLRDAIAIANSSTSPTTITFDPTVFAAAQTIVLGGTQLVLSGTSEPTTITGPATGVTVSGGGRSSGSHTSMGHY
jgi:hypothetical protein